MELSRSQLVTYINEVTDHMGTLEEEAEDLESAARETLKKVEGLMSYREKIRKIRKILKPMRRRMTSSTPSLTNWALMKRKMCNSLSP